jgi:hypothetical protein
MCVMARYNKFDDESEHDSAVFISQVTRSSGPSNIAAGTATVSPLIPLIPVRHFAFSPRTPLPTYLIRPSNL